MKASAGKHFPIHICLPAHASALSLRFAIIFMTVDPYRIACIPMLASLQLYHHTCFKALKYILPIYLYRELFKQGYSIMLKLDTSGR